MRKLLFKYLVLLLEYEHKSFPCVCTFLEYVYDFAKHLFLYY